MLGKASSEAPSGFDLTEWTVESGGYRDHSPYGPWASGRRKTGKRDPLRWLSPGIAEGAGSEMVRAKRDGRRGRDR